MAFELHQTSAVEVQGSPRLRLRHVRNPGWAIVGMTALELDVPEDTHAQSVPQQRRIDQIPRESGLYKFVFPQRPTLTYNALLVEVRVLRLFRVPTDPGTERRPGGAAGFGDDLGTGEQFVQSRPGFGSIGLLRPVNTGRDDQHAVLRGAIAG